MKKIISLFTILLSTSVVFGQLEITSPSHGPSNPVSCNDYNDPDDKNFIDGAGNYAPAMNETFTICPDLTTGGPKLYATFNNIAGLVWDVHPSDTLYVYDGPNVNSPLLGAYNNGVAIGGFNATSSWANTTGCLTFKFVSDGVNQGAGWEANIVCFSPPQDIIMHVEGSINGTPGNDMFPLDIGYVDVCQGDSVLFVAKPEFPYSLENTGSGYSQNLNNVDYLWKFSDGTIGANSSSVWFKPPGQGGYLVDLIITDSQSSNAALRSKVRVGTTPSFVDAGVLNDTVCFNQNTSLAGGVTTTDTVGMDIPVGSFQMGGTFAGLLYIPDGNSVYTTTITMTDFPQGATVTSASDIEKMCVTMEHSWMGDLEMWLTCPDGTEITIFNAYNGQGGSSGHIPGGFSAGSLYFGEPIKTSGTGPGNGYEYCFSSTQNNWGSIRNTYNNPANIIQTPSTAPSPNNNTLNPNGVYAPEQSYADFTGCPLNGDWTLNVGDFWGGDDGYIFEWGIYFDPTLFPDNETFQNNIVDAYWSNHPTIVSDTTNDTLVVVVPDDIGNFFYTLNVTDDFGCHYDTIINLFVKDTLLNSNALDTTLVCFFSDSIPLWVNATGTVPPFDFEWESGQNGDTAFYKIEENGIHKYPITISDACGFTVRDTAYIRMNQTLSIDSLIQHPADCGMTNGAVVALSSGYTGTPNHKWTGPGEGNPANTIATAWLDKPSGWYYYSVKDNVCKVIDSIFLEQMPPPTADFETNPSQGPAPLSVTFVNTSSDAAQYDWDFGNGNGNSVPDKSNQYTNYPLDGVYTVTLVASEGACTDQATKTVYVYLPVKYDMTNVFTPDGDGDNDFFTVNAENATAFEIVILNRWGAIVFESDDPNFAWNGNVNNNGPECTDGTYFYKFKIEGDGNQEEEEHGFVQLLRGKK